MAERNSNNLPERYLSEELEIARDPRHDLRALPPEVALGQGPERAYEDLEHPQVDFPEVVRPSSNKKRPCAKRSRCIWIIGIVICLIVVAAGVGGGVGSHKKHVASITPLVPTSSPTHPATPLPSPNPSGPVSNSSAALLSNSSIATATCANGNRWLFFQHLTGSIYGSQYVLSSLQYTTTSKELNFTIPKIGTNLGASCVYINSLFYNYTPLDIGDYISLVYLDSLHQIQQTVLDKGTWRNSPIPPPVLPPANDTKLSVSTVLVPESPTVNGSLETPLVSSVLTYVSTNSSIATTLLLNYISLGLSNAELLSTFRLTSVSSSSAGIASLVNVFFSNGSNTVNLYSQFSSGANSQLHGWSINDFTYSYTEAMLGKPMDSVLDTAIDIEYPTNIGTEISLLQFPDNATAEVYTQPNNSLATVVRSFYHKAGAPSDISVWNSPVILPFGHFSATSLPAKSTTLYCYYQVNDTAVAEISFNATVNLWGEPAFVKVV